MSVEKGDNMFFCGLPATPVQPGGHCWQHGGGNGKTRETGDG